MEAEKRSSKGGFLQLFDWNVKSRKKLFSNKPDVPESSKHGKENVHNLAISRLQQMRLDESIHGPSLTGNDWASSTSNDEGTGSKAPGVVARLMGLDSLPTLDASDPGFTPHIYPHSVRHSVEDYGMRNKLDGFSKNPFEERLQKFQNRAIEKFQAEVLPPKSAKSVPSTHHRMLSPIKSPGFVLTRNAASVMEEASKIIEQSQQSTLTRRLPSSGSSSVPLRIRDLKEKLEEADHRPKTYSPVNSTKRPCRTEIVVLKHGTAGSLKNTNKSVTPGKTNNQILVGSTSRNSSSTMKQKDCVNKPVQLDKKQRNTPKRVQSRSTTGKTPEVLKQNNQKQNTASRKDRTNLKPRVPYQDGRKTTATSGFCKEVKTLKKAVENSPRKARLVTPESLSTTKKLSGKRPSDGDIMTDGSATNSIMIKEKERSVKCNITIDGSSNWDRKIGMDVVSFTFTSPIKKSGSESESCGQLSMKSRCLFQEDTETAPAIDGDALSVLLEQKLKEISSLLETSQCDTVKGGSDISSVDQTTLVNARMDWQGVEVTECSENYESGFNDEHQHEHPCTGPSPEPSLSDDSCITSNSTTTLTSNGNTQYMSAARNMELWAEEIELQDSATSFPSSIFDFTFMARWSTQRELEYIKEMINSTEFVLDDLAFDPTQKVISTDLFNQLENQHKNIGPLSKQQRKALFDCVSVCLEDRRERGLSGGYEEWSKWSTVFQKKDLLADEIQKQIRGWRSMEELMVDEVVETDMSSGDGKWLNFKAEGLEEGAVIGIDILTVLIDEIVVDFLSC
ncbi:hypothetical protein HanXRQr2_Chr09g0375461 [Helianthus annuus]|uniref:DUF4378 domain-containing protein n=1 Tax=Helianthus annuus TaxID=4232 RepID=A0A251TTD2_HELAN|nr:uncharacterized protein LOC110877855 [Helianthus annuus]KAF5789797.1 hypothetical protein HanXRQr2_Chr09g0375461 [Helianthus annuus]